ncbi:MAG: hypothetical protein AB1512_21355 [Thermodesulfobacteriota bacterium]
MSVENDDLKGNRHRKGKQSCCHTEPRSSSNQQQDFELAMRGVGKEIWADQGGDLFIESLRCDRSNEHAPRRKSGSKTKG